MLSVAEDGRGLLSFQARDPQKSDGWGPVGPYLAAVDPGGTPQPAVRIPMLGQSSAYPAIAAASSGRAFIAWTEHASGTTNVTLSRARIRGQ
ncbi:MAG: hypothetical protein AB7O65_08720 [Candidatus Korobacteraceae bacterium]